VDINGSLKHIHADKLREYHIAVDEIVCDTVVAGHAQTKINHCTVIYDNDHDFGEIDVSDANQKVNSGSDGNPTEPLPSQKNNMNSLSHFTKEQQTKLLAVLDRYSCCFSEKSGLCKIIQHEINISEDRGLQTKTVKIIQSTGKSEANGRRSDPRVVKFGHN